MLLGLTVGLSAQEYNLTHLGKGLYSAGRSYFFQADQGSISWAGGKMDKSGDFIADINSGVDTDGESVGSVAGCVFNSALYAFCTTTSGELQYVKVNASTGAPMFNSTKTIAKGVSANGAAAAVMGGRIYVFTASDTFSSSDGTHFTRGFPGPDGADTVLDAVAFYPPDDAPPLPDSKVQGAIMVFFTHGEDLETEIFQGPDYGFSGAPTKLPNPLSYPVAQGNCILGTVAASNLGPAGAKDPCIQFYGCAANATYEDQPIDYEYGRWEYDQKSGLWTAEKWASGSAFQGNPGLIVAPWFKEIDTTSHLLQLQQLVWDVTGPLGGMDNFSAIGSDYQVPMYSDNDWQGKYTDTSVATPGQDLANLWTIVGIVLGPPPFPPNGQTDFCSNPNEWSFVSYGSEQSTTVSTESTSSSTVSIASNTKIEAGLGEAELGLSYAHGWTSAHGHSKTITVSQEYSFGPCNEFGTQGIHGWVIYDAPTLATQRYKLYAYDYKESDGSGTYLGQSLYATATAHVSQVFDYFELQDPSKGGQSGLMTGMPLYPDSTDVDGWYQVGQQEDWDNGGSDWSTIIKSDFKLSLGGSGAQSFSEEDTTVDSKGNTNSFGVEAGASLNIEGFSQSLTVGYDAEWETTTDVEVSLTKSVQCGLDEPIPDNPPSGYVTQIHVQPYWLQAKTNKAPWIPKGYGGNLPWCVTWGVTDITKAGGSRTGLAAPPALAEGKVRHGGEKARDTYEIDGGALSWLDADGGVVPLPLTADAFDPNLGASVSLNGYTFPADGSKGKWVRSGDVWKYKTRDGVKKDPFKLALDFGTGTWSFKGASKNLDQAIKASLGNVRMDLTVEGLYRFTSRVQCNVDCTWDQKEAKADRQPYGVHRVKGEYDSSTGSGSLVLKGHIPKGTDAYGDVEILVNGSPVDIPLLSTQDFLQKLQQGGAVDYEADGIAYKVNFGKGKWTLHLDGAAFKKEMAPSKGAVHVQVLVGGVPTSDQTFELSHTNTGLTYGG